jgi:hypothetical protein
MSKKVYIVKTLESNKVKIGVSKTPEKRIKSLQTACPEILQTMAIIDGEEGLEKEFHSYFHKLRLHGEWFEYNKTIPLTAQLLHLINNRDKLISKRGFWQYQTELTSVENRLFLEELKWYYRENYPNAEQGKTALPAVE